MIEEIRNAIERQPVEDVVSRFVLERVPFVFGDNWDLLRGWRASLSALLEVDPCNLCITGSACVGVSLSPNKKLREFREDSDIDVAVISPYHFDVAWRCLRNLRIGDVSNGRQRQALTDHQKRYIYWGCVATDRILSLLPFATDWMSAAAKQSQIAPTEGRAINFRIYKDYDALRSYQMRGVESLRNELLS